MFVACAERLSELDSQLAKSQKEGQPIHRSAEELAVSELISSLTPKFAMTRLPPIQQ